MWKLDIGLAYIALGVAGVGAAVARGDFGFVVVPAVLIGAGFYIVRLMSDARP